MLLEKYKNVVDTTKSITFNDEELIISGFGADLVTVGDLKTYYNISEFESIYDASVIVTDGEKELLDTDTIKNG